MNNQVQKQATEVQALVKKERMTSVEIAEITGKQHKNVMQAIRAMEPAWEKVYGLKFQLIQRISDLGNGRTRKDPCYSLTKTECLYIATKFNDEARARLILRWEELEKELLRAPRPAEPSEKDRVLPQRGADVRIFFADSEEMAKFAMFTREVRPLSASHESINKISVEVSHGSNAVHLNSASSLVNSTHPRIFSLYMFTRENQVCLYNGSPVTFNLSDGTTKVNATQMAKPFGKLVAGWLRLDSTKEFLNALSADMQIHISALIQTVKGGNGEQGTWMHEDVALEFARWLSPAFAIWCNRRIKELLCAPKPSETPEEDRVLPPPIYKQQITSDLTEIVDGRAVTTSRKLAAVLGRKHHSVLRTINQNLHRREFKYGHFIRRKYTSGRCGHGPEYLITRKGLSALAEAMRGGAAEKIAEAYAGAWGKAALSDRAIPSPAPEQLRLPLGAESVQPESNVTTEGNAGDSEYDELVNLLAHRLGALAKELAASRATQRTYSELYEREKRMRQEAAADKGMWADLYTDLLYNVAESDRGSLDERLEAHKNFRNKMLRKVKLS